MSRYRITPRGPFALTESLAFLETWPAGGDDAAPDGVLRFACCAEEGWEAVGVRVGQRDGTVQVDAEPTVPKSFRNQVTRALSLDVDGRGFAAVGRRDPVIGALQEGRSGLRPVCFWSPYEAAVWSILSQRVSMVQGSRLMQSVAGALGEVVMVEGHRFRAFPGPERLLAVGKLEGVPALKVQRLHAVADAALLGELAGNRLRAEEDPEVSMGRLKQIPGIGPFSAGLILIRGAGHPDVFPGLEARLGARIRVAYSQPDASDAGLAEIADTWRPFRSWCGFLLRSATDADIEAARA